MLGKKGSLLALALALLAAFGAGQARLSLDGIVAEFRDKFNDLKYLPKGNALKIIALGYDAPLADALFIKGMLNYAQTPGRNPGGTPETTDEFQARLDFTYDLYNTVTDLSPRFTRAYQMGAFFLTASESGKSDLDGCALLEKGIANVERMAEAGTPVEPDPRWLFHSILASTYDTKIQTRRRQAGDLIGAADARQRAAKEFRLAAMAPGASLYLAQVASGYESVMSGKGNIEESQKAVLSVWKELERQAQERGDKDILPDIQNRIKLTEKWLTSMYETRELEKILSEAGQQYEKRENRDPGLVEDLVKAGVIPFVPVAPLGKKDEPDAWLALPGGKFKSKLLAGIETQGHLDFLYNAALDFYRANNRAPLNMDDLLDGKYLTYFPEPPLKGLGQEYQFNVNTGLFESAAPEGPEVPPAPYPPEDDVEDAETEEGAAA